MKSPIERKMLTALLAVRPKHTLIVNCTKIAPLGYDIAKREMIWDPPGDEEWERFHLAMDSKERLGDLRGYSRLIEIYADVPILSYRADFLIQQMDSLALVVECDGHDHHNITKQQAAYDRSRDRELLKHGIRTVRFTGSEITHSPERCVADVMDVIAVLDNEGAEHQRDFCLGWERGVANARSKSEAAQISNAEEHW